MANLSCPECGGGFNSWDILKYLRLHSIDCSHCNSPLALSGRGRSALVISLLASILLGSLIMALTESELALFLTIIAGIVVGSLTGVKYGELLVSGKRSDESPYKKER